VINGLHVAGAAENVIRIHGAREHNLKNLDLVIPRDCFVVVTGVSGSGKSTLAFDLLFAEGQRRFLDSMSAYARQYVEQLSRPEVDLITGLPPTVSIEQRNTRGGGKSTVATVTEVYHFLRLLYARVGTQFCPDCQVPVQAQGRDQLCRRLLSDLRKTGELVLLAPLVKQRKGFHTDVARWAARQGYEQLRADGEFHSTAETFRLERFRAHDIELVVGRLGKGKARKSGKTPRELIDETLRLGNGTLVALAPGGAARVHSIERTCHDCGRSFRPLDPKDFSYNSAQGWCPKCRGFGELFYLPEVERGARADAIEESWYGWQEGSREICPECGGARLNPAARAVRLLGGEIKGRKLSAKGAFAQFSGGPGIDVIGNSAVEVAREYFKALVFGEREAAIARDILPEIVERLQFLCEVGLGYLQLGRGATTLSGGEAQRIRLAAQLGSNLSGVLYVLDEPTIGLHARDNEQLLVALNHLRERGNSLLVVEHDEATMRRADYIIDLGPGAGVHGGEVVAGGTLSELIFNEDSVTGRCLRERRSFPSRGVRRPVQERGGLTLRKAAANNLKNLTVRFPLQRLVVVTGVSGSGKSSLVRECLLPRLKVRTGNGKGPGERGASTELEGFEAIKAVYEVDQSPIGRTPRSTPATYVGFFDEIRRLFSQTPEARLRGYNPGRFSFNSPAGRCPACEGAGTVKLEMSFLPPAFVRCESCHGCRFNRETLDIAYRGKNVAQVLEMSVEEAIEFFVVIRKVRQALEALRDTGLHYLQLGQISPTLSGGEAQRLKLVTHLLSGLKESREPSNRLPRHNMFILEEPTIGLHMADVQRLVEVLQRLVDAGHSVIVIEHNLDLISEADWVIDLGPEAGADGGEIVAQGTPEDVARNQRSHTGRFLRNILGR
jgi:excinuclease ABC subunit A